MIDGTSQRDPAAAPPDPLALTVGCEFTVETLAPLSAVLQVAPRPQPAVRIQREQWSTVYDHHGYLDLYENRCERFSIEAGASVIAYEAELLLTDPADVILPDLAELPDELGSEAWERFGHLPPGWARVQAVVDFVHGHLEWVAGASNPWTTAVDAFRARQGVCRDFAHLAITLCRALNIPARYVFGYLPAIGVVLEEPMDFAAWFEVYLDGGWHTFDARNNEPRIGRVVVGRGRDAVDVALITSFGALTLTGFQVTAEPTAGRSSGAAIHVP
jgi:transglutaminase-like putative cysteine protease